MSHISFEWFRRSERDKVRVTDIVTDGLTLVWEVSIPACGDDHDKRVRVMKTLEGLGNTISSQMASHQPHSFPVERDGILGDLIKQSGFKDIEPLSFMAWNPKVEAVLFYDPNDPLTILHHLETYVPNSKTQFANAAQAEGHSNQKTHIDPAVSDDDPTLSMGL
jgi:hypothetical protein